MKTKIVNTPYVDTRVEFVKTLAIKGGFKYWSTILDKETECQPTAMSKAKNRLDTECREYGKPFKISTRRSGTHHKQRNFGSRYRKPE